MKITTNYPQIRPLQSTKPAVLPAVPPTPIPTSLLLGKDFPSKLPGGGELTSDGAQALMLGLNFTVPGFASGRALVRGNASPGAAAACYISPLLTAQRSNNPKLVEGVQSFTSLIAANCGPKFKLLHDTAWLGHDFIVFYRDRKNPKVSQGARQVSFGALGSSMVGVLAGAFHKGWLDSASTTFQFAALIGDHVHTGNLKFSQSELLQLSSAPGAEEYSKIVALTELVLPST
jgi:hypothetical protein